MLNVVQTAKTSLNEYLKQLRQTQAPAPAEGVSLFQPGPTVKSQVEFFQVLLNVFRSNTLACEVVLSVLMGMQNPDLNPLKQHIATTCYPDDMDALAQLSGTLNKVVQPYLKDDPNLIMNLTTAVVEGIPGKPQQAIEELNKHINQQSSAPKV